MPPAIVIVGGGAIGSAIAYFLTRDPAFIGSVTVVERDPTYRMASSALSASSIRQQFSTPINIAMSQFGVDFAREIGLVEQGYLFLAGKRGVERMRSNHAIQREHGVDVTLLDPAALRERFPWLSTDGVILGSLGLRGEGWFDGYLLLQLFRTRALAQGAVYRRGEVRGMEISGDRATAARLSDGTTIPLDIVVNAAGPWAASVGAMLNADLPVRARRRCVYVFTAPGSLERCPLVIDTSGVYFRPEGESFIAGISPPEENDPDDLPLEAERAMFDEIIWPALARRVPLFERVKLRRSWAGYYEYNIFDHNGIVGALSTLSNAYVASGFSGHGLQHAPAVGRGIAELILHGAYRTLDLTPLSFARIVRREPIVEVNVI